MTKNFDEWNTVKQQLDSSRNLPTFKEREIWWASVGLNIGHEIYGKNSMYTRPVLIVRKFSGSTFLGVPMTTGQKEGQFRYPYTIKGGKEGFLLFDQTRTLDGRRLTRLIVTLPEPEFEKIRRAMKARLNL